eukprot:m.247295 g.247295  ORF g.247295 m.247295 type:complete len:107 (+) comp40265_c0_seq34:394-714(+)
MTWYLVDTSQGVQPKGRSECCLCAVGSRMIMFGGWPFDDKLYEFKCDERKKGAWEEVKAGGTQPGKRQGAAMAVIDDRRALLHGGFIYLSYLDDFLVIDLKSKVIL